MVAAAAAAVVVAAAAAAVCAMEQPLGGEEVLCPCLPAPPHGRLVQALVLVLVLELERGWGGALLLQVVVVAVVPRQRLPWLHRLQQ